MLPKIMLRVTVSEVGTEHGCKIPFVSAAQYLSDCGCGSLKEVEARLLTGGKYELFGYSYEGENSVEIYS